MAIKNLRGAESEELTKDVTHANFSLVLLQGKCIETTDVDHYIDLYKKHFTIDGHKWSYRTFNIKYNSKLAT